MILYWKLLLILGMVVLVHSCYDSVHKKYYSKGDIFPRTKVMKDSTLLGHYSCECQWGGRIYCNATDIPCLDYESKKFVPKGERFVAMLFRSPYICTCLGGRGSFNNCNAAKPTECNEVTSQKLFWRTVSEGEEYNTFRFGRYVRCLCGKNGEPLRSSCSPVSNSLPTTRLRDCIDVVTYKRVMSGSYFTTSKRGKRMRCRCVNGEAELCDTPITSYRKTVVRVRPAPTRYPVYPVPYPRPRPRPRPRPVPVSPEEEEDPHTNTIDPCIKGITLCDARARCAPDGRFFTCICIVGFTGDGTTCADIDECTEGFCDTNAECDNTAGSYHCRCREGYRGDGRSCQKMCQDGETGAYVPHGDTFITVTHGRRQLCTCRRGEVDEHSCIDDSIAGTEETEVVPISTTPATTTTKMSRKRLRCRDKPGYYHAGESYIRSYAGVNYRCTCISRKRGLVSSCRPA